MLSLNNPRSAKVSHKHGKREMFYYHIKVLLLSSLSMEIFFLQFLKGCRFVFLGNYCARNAATEINGHEALN